MPAYQPPNSASPASQTTYSWIYALLLASIMLIMTICFWPSQPQHSWANTGFIDLSKQIALLEDEHHRFTFNTIKENHEPAFKPWDKSGVFNAGYSQSRWWIRIQLPENKLCEHCVLEIPYANLYNVTLYLADGSYLEAGKSIAKEKQPWPHRYIAFPIELTDNTKQLLLSIESTSPLTVPIILWEPKAFAENIQLTYMGLAVYYGGVITLALYNLLIFLSLREKLFLYYALFASSMFIALFAGNGVAGQYIWPHTWQNKEYIQPCLYLLTLLTGINFSRHFLDAPSQMPRMNYLMQTLLYSELGIILISPYIQPAIVVWQLMSACALLSVFLIFIAAIYSLQCGNINSRLFLLAWSTLLIGITTATLRNFNWIPTSLITANAVQFSSAFEMLLLSFALANRIRHERNAREVAQLETLRVRQALVETLQASEAQLERSVAERTQELNRSLENERSLLERYIRFGAFISHEFRNPLAIIKAQVSLLRKEASRGINNLEQRIAAILSANERLGRLFDDWLSSDRLRQTTQSLSLSQVAIASWLQRCTAEWCERNTQHQFTLQLSTNLPTLLMDEPMLRIALDNLADNAAKYCPTGTLIEISAKTHKTQLCIQIRDHGPGIAEEFHAHVFKDYFRVNPTQEISGLGLGLALVKRVIELHGGQITLNSTLGTGCCFSIYLPLTELGVSHHA